VKNIVGILLSLIMFAQATYQVGVYTYYVLNKQYIIDTHCENKATLTLQCDGKCHLRSLIDTQEITQDHSKEKSPIPNLAEIEPLVLFCESNHDKLPTAQGFQSFFTSTSVFWYRFDYQYQYTSSLLDPPKFVA